MVQLQNSAVKAPMIQYHMQTNTLDRILSDIGGLWQAVSGSCLVLASGYIYDYFFKKFARDIIAKDFKKQYRRRQIHEEASDKRGLPDGEDLFDEEDAPRPPKKAREPRTLSPSEYSKLFDEVLKEKFDDVYQTVQQRFSFDGIYKLYDEVLELRRVQMRRDEPTSRSQNPSAYEQAPKEDASTQVDGSFILHQSIEDQLKKQSKII